MQRWERTGASFPVRHDLPAAARRETVKTIDSLTASE